MYGELLTTFRGRPVVEAEGPDDWQGPSRAYRLRTDWDDTTNFDERLGQFLDAHAESLEALIVGCWADACEGGGPEAVIEALRRHAPRLAALRHLFCGEITYEECELSWIVQTDYGPLLESLPSLETLRVRGGTSLSFSPVRHEGLRELAIETGGLSRDVIRQVQRLELPNLESLEILLGEENYGFDAEPDDFVPLLSGELHPKLRRLGLMNATIANDLAALVVNSPIVSQIEVLDLSMGTLDDQGAAALTGLPSGTALKTINLSHHYVTDEALAKLRSSPVLSKVEVIAEDGQLGEAEDDWRPILHAE